MALSSQIFLLSTTVYISTVSSYYLLPILQNWFKLDSLWAIFGIATLHSHLTYANDQTSQGGIKCTKAKGITVLIYTVIINVCKSRAFSAYALFPFA